jgi:hypothetical protein
MTSPEETEAQHTLRTAVARFEELRGREALAGAAGLSDDDGVAAEQLSAAEVLELLALGEVIARKAGYGRQLSVRTARATGASWSAIGRALGTSKQAAWEAHTRWIDEQVDQNRGSGHEGFDDVAAARARTLAGSPDDDRRTP